MRLQGVLTAAKGELHGNLSQVTVEPIPYNESDNPQGGKTVTIG